MAFAGLEVQAVGHDTRGDDDDDDETKTAYVYVTRGTKAALRDLPEEIGDVRVRVVNVGRLAIRLEAASGKTTNRPHLFEHNGRIACGSSCAPSGEAYSGTFGAIVQVANDADIFLLSNNHVFGACNHTPIGQPIMSPSAADSAPNMRVPTAIGKHENIVELRSGDPDLVEPVREDVAIARVTHGRLVSSWQGDDIDGFDTPTDVVAPRSGMRVKKYGRTTGLTLGEVESFVLTGQPLPYDSRYFKGTVWVEQTWTIRGDNGLFALPGDSGSLVVTEDGTAAVGLLFAESNKGQYGWIVPLDHVMRQFGGLTLVSGHGV